MSVADLEFLPKYPEIVVQLTGEDGNALAIMGRVTHTMRRAGLTSEEIDQFRAQCLGGDYDDLLRTVMKWVDVR